MAEPIERMTGDCALELLRSSFLSLQQKYSWQNLPRTEGISQISKSALSHLETPAFLSGTTQILAIFEKEVILPVFQKNYKSKSTIRENLWRRFHLTRISHAHVLDSLLMFMLSSSGITSSTDAAALNPLLGQSLYQELFEKCIQHYFKKDAASSSSECSPEEIDKWEMSADEANVVRYVAGYVVRSLLKKYEKKTDDRSLIFVECLQEMNAEEVSHKDDDVLFFTRRWVETVNRGGLCKISDEVFFLFIEIESCVRVFIPKQMLKKPQSDSFVSFDQFLCDNVQKNENVQRRWAVLSQDIDDNDDAQVLLFDIIKLWVTV